MSLTTEVFSRKLEKRNVNLLSDYIQVTWILNPYRIFIGDSVGPDSHDCTVNNKSAYLISRKQNTTKRPWLLVFPQKKVENKRIIAHHSIDQSASIRREFRIRDEGDKDGSIFHCLPVLPNTFLPQKGPKMVHTHFRQRICKEWSRVLYI